MPNVPQNVRAGNRLAAILNRAQTRVRANATPYLLPRISRAFATTSGEALYRPSTSFCISAASMPKEISRFEGPFRLPGIAGSDVVSLRSAHVGQAGHSKRAAIDTARRG